MIGWGIQFQVPGLGGQVSGAGVQVQVQVQENPVPEPGAEDLNLEPEEAGQDSTRCCPCLESALCHRLRPRRFLVPNR